MHRDTRGRAARAGRCWRPRRRRHRPRPATRARRAPTELPPTPSLPSQLTPPPAPVDRQRGVALGLFAEDVSFSYGPLLAEIVALGATHVALVVPLYQTDGAATTSALHTRYSPTLAARGRGDRAPREPTASQVTLFPIVRLSSPAPGEWRGTLAPRDRDAWLRSYGDLLVELAASRRVDRRRRAWSSAASCRRWTARPRPLAAASSSACARVFPGKLVYSANWDHYRDAPSTISSTRTACAATSTCATPRRPRDDATLDARLARLRAGARALARRPGAPLRLHRARLPLAHGRHRRRHGTRARAARSISTSSAAATPPSAASGRRAPVARRRLRLELVRLGRPRDASYTPRGKPAEAEVRALLGGLWARRPPLETTPASRDDAGPHPASALARPDSTRARSAPRLSAERLVPRAASPRVTGIARDDGFGEAAKPRGGEAARR